MADLRMNDGHTLPAVGCGLYKVAPDDTEATVLAALEAGYRLVDGAEFYGNEAQVGRALAQVDRSTVTVTSKFWGEESQSRDALLRSFDASEQALGTHIDVYMIHWPRWKRDQYVGVWEAMIELRDAGRVRTLGVSNFQPEHIDRLIAETGVTPAINQVESHPWLPQHDLRDYHARHGIVTQAHSPLGRGRLFDEPLLAEIAREHGATTAQVMVAWHLALGGALIPKSTRPERLAENMAAEHIELDADDLAAIAGLATGQRLGTHPDDRQ